MVKGSMMATQNDKIYRRGEKQTSILYIDYIGIVILLVILFFFCNGKELYKNYGVFEGLGMGERERITRQREVRE